MTSPLAGSIILFLSLQAAIVYAQSSNSFAIQGVRVFDGDRVLPRVDVIVRDGRIAALRANAAVPAGLPVIDGAGKTLLPGLIDSHVHVFPGAPSDALRFGVTTELDMFDVSHAFDHWRKQRESLDKTTEADVWAAGTGVTAPGGAPLQNLPPGTVPALDKIADPRAFVDDRLREGSDYIKLFIEDLSEYGPAKRLPTLSREQVCAVIQAAHEAGKMAIVHVQQERAALEAMDCGANGLAHAFPDRVADAAFIESAKRHHVFVLSTLDVWAAASEMDLADRLATDPRVARYLSAAQEETLLAKDKATVAKTTVPKFFSHAVENVRLLHRAGVPILAGTDAPNPGTAHGISLHEELGILVSAGFTPAEALHSATALPDKVFGLGGRGHIAVGGRADLLLVNGNPVEDIRSTLNIERIWKNGYPVDRTPTRNH